MFSQYRRLFPVSEFSRFFPRSRGSVCKELVQLGWNLPPSVGQTDGRWKEGCSTVRVHLKIQGNERTSRLLQYWFKHWIGFSDELMPSVPWIIWVPYCVIHLSFYPWELVIDTCLLNTTANWKEGSEARTASSLSLARVRPSAITNGTNKHSSTTGSSSSSTSSSHSKTQRSASTYHRQRRHSDFCESLF